MNEQELLVGTPIYTSDSDDDKIGEVSEIRGDKFKVNAAMMPDYWLSLDDVATVDADGVRMSFTKDELGDRRVEVSD